MQHVHVVLRDEAADVRVAVRSRNVVQVPPLSWAQRGVLRSRGQGRDEWEQKASSDVTWSTNGVLQPGGDGQTRLSRTLRKGAALTVPGMGSAASCWSLAAVVSVNAVGTQKSHSRSGTKEILFCIFSQIFLS